MLRSIISYVARRTAISEHAAVTARGVRGIASSNVLWVKKMPDRPPLVHESEFTEAFLKGSGPGGQKINKTSSAVQLRHLPTGLVLKVQATRSRTQNRKIAREMLALKLEELAKGKDSRVAVVAATKKKRKDSADKKKKRKYKLLDKAKNKGVGAIDGLTAESEESQNFEEGEDVEELEDSTIDMVPSEDVKTPGEGPEKLP